MNAADSVLVSPITFFEIAQKVRLGKWPEMEPFVSRSMRSRTPAPWALSST